MPMSVEEYPSITDIARREDEGVASTHSIHNGLTVSHGTHSYYHGEKVAIGVQAGLFFGDRPQAIVAEVYGFCESVGLPTTVAEIGLKDIDHKELAKAAEAACAEGESIHNEPSPVCSESVLAAIRLADAFGRTRKLAV